MRVLYLKLNLFFVVSQEKLLASPSFQSQVSFGLWWSIMEAAVMSGDAKKVAELMR